MRVVLIFVCVLVALAAACGGSSKPATAPTPRGVPSPVPTPPPAAEGFTLADPALDALPGAKVETGTLGGTHYQIEIPDNWNRRLVMYTHGNDIRTDLQVYPPVNRQWLITHGYAWASSSYSVNVLYVSGIAADETAALWDLFVQTHGRPDFTYAMGDSMGGAAAFTAAERYPDRYDGALPLCADAPPSRVELDFFVAAAYAAGVTQTDYDASDPGTIIDRRIRPALEDPATRRRFDALWTDLSGGPRPFVARGVDIYLSQLWTTSLGNIIPGSEGNDGVRYTLGPSAGVSSDDFNRGALRFRAKPGANRYADNNVITGDIKIPTLTVQPTGDALTVFSSSQELRRRVEAKGKGGLLVQRAIQSPQHCFDRGMSQAEIADSFQALVDWVEHGKKPAGEDLLGDLTHAGEKFTLSPRVESDAAAAVPGAAQRVTLKGGVTLDGQPVDSAFMWAMVRDSGLMRTCSYERVVNAHGTYSMAVAADAETPGCGKAGVDLLVGLFLDGKRYVSEPLPWPSTPGMSQLDLAFTTAHPIGGGATEESIFGAQFSGDLLDASGKPLGPGTTVEAYIGGVRCGAFAVPPVMMVFDETSGYTLSVASPDVLPACTSGGTISFRVNGKDTGQTAKNEFSEQGHQLDLRAR